MWQLAPPEKSAVHDEKATNKLVPCKNFGVQLDSGLFCFFLVWICSFKLHTTQRSCRRWKQIFGFDKNTFIAVSCFNSLYLRAWYGNSLKYCGARLVETSDFLLQFATVYPQCGFLLKQLKDIPDRNINILTPRICDSSCSVTKKPG